MGLDVLVLKPPDEDTVARPASLERAARSVGAIAAIRLVPGTEGHVEVWVADRVTGKAVVRELEAGDAGASDAAVAVESVELLRASLMELHSGEPSRGEVPPTDEVQALALRPLPRPSPPWLGLSVGGGAELGLRGIGPSADAELSLWVRVASRFGARLLGGVSVAPSHAVTAPGSVDVRSQIAGAMATFDLAGAESAWIPSVSLGAGAAHVSAAGTATPPYLCASEDAWTGAAIAGAGIAWRFVRDLAPARRRRGGLDPARGARPRPPAGTTSAGGARLPPRLARPRGDVAPLRWVNRSSRRP